MNREETSLHLPAWRWAAYDIAAWSAISLLFAADNAARSPNSFARVLAATAVGFIPCAMFTPVIALTAERARFADGVRRALAAHIAGLAIFLLAGGAMMGAFEWLLPWRPVGDGIAAAMRRGVGQYVAIDVIIYIMVATTATAYVYAREARERAVRAALLQAQLAEARLHALGAQLHPHFLFNTLHAISALVRPDPKRAEQLIARLSELLRQMLDASDQVEITLEEELALLEKYVDIQEARFGPRLQVSFEIAPAVLGLRVPRLVLQPLVENAIRHGIAPRAGAGRVEVHAGRTNGHLTLTVRDDGVGLRGGQASRDGVGLSITRARLVQLYGDAQSFTILSDPVGGTVCTVQIPCSE